MTDPKAYLRQVKVYDTKINCKLDEVTQLRSVVTKITATWKDDVVSGSGSQDKLGDTVAKIIDLQDEINKDVDAYVGLKKEVWGVLEKVENPEQFQVLFRRYFKYEHWEEIACAMNMTYRNVCYIHGRALRAVAEVLKGM